MDADMKKRLRHHEDMYLRRLFGMLAQMAKADGKVDFAETGKLLHVILPYVEQGDKDALKLKSLLAEVRADGKIDKTESEIVIGLLDVLSERYAELTAGLER